MQTAGSSISARAAKATTRLTFCDTRFRTEAAVIVLPKSTERRNGDFAPAGQNQLLVPCASLNRVNVRGLRILYPNCLPGVEG